MRSISAQLVAIAGLTITATPVVAHHSIAQFLRDPVLTLDGVVTDIKWSNPHVYFQLETTDEQGRAETWTIEAAPPGAMIDKGLAKDTLALGERVTVTAAPHRDASIRIARFDSVRKEDGTVISLASASPAAEYQARDISGVWLPSSETVATIRRFRDKSTWSLTKAGQVVVDSYVDDNYVSCEPIPWPRAFAGSRFPIQIEINENVVRIQRNDDLREIELAADTHANAPDSILGHAIGRWEDGSLVVDTSNFLEHRTGHGAGLPSSAMKHVTERFALSQDGTKLVYTVSVEDPVYLAEPFAGTFEFDYRPDLSIEVFPCIADSAD